MSRVVVIGGGLAGIATAARLAKQRHQVLLCERAPRLGGALRPIVSDGFEWDGGAATTTLPAVLRDLFRKTGRPMERELALHPVASPRRHHFRDGTVLDLPTTGRGAQLEALTQALGARAAEQWTALLDDQGDAWEVLRRRALEVPFAGCDAIGRAGHRLLRQRVSLHSLGKRTLADDRLRTLLWYPTRLGGSQTRDTPAYLAVEPYLERTFGIWRPEGGMAALVDALADRLDTRKVDVRTRATVDRVERDGSAQAVVLTDGTRLAADAVVAAIHPRAAYALLGRPLPATLQRLTPAVPPSVTHLGLEPGAPEMPFETVLHGEPLLVVRRESPRTCTVLVRGALHEDVLTALARRGVDLRPHATVRVDRSATDIIEASGGSSPYGVAWRGPRTAEQRAAPGTPVDGLFLTGASAHPGAGVPLVGLGAAQCAEVVQASSATAG